MLRTAPLLALFLLAAGCVTPAATPEGLAPAAVAGVDAEGFAPVLFEGFVFRELDLSTDDGLRLHADVYLPDVSRAASPDAPEKFPAILLLSPYWGSGTMGQDVGYMPYDFLVDRLLPRGYAVVFGDLGGSGGSSGCWDFMGPVEREMSVAMVEAIAEQEWSDGKVGMMGLSYDGMTQIMAASDQAPHLVTVVPAAPLTHAYAGLIQNGVHYAGGWHATVAAYESSSITPPLAPQRTPGWIERLRESPACLASNHAGDQPTNAYTDYYEARDYRPLGKDVKASVFYIQGFLDGAVKPDNFGAWFHEVPTLKKAWLGFWFHQYPTAQNAGRDDMVLALHRWFDHTLKGIDNGIDREPAIDVQDSRGRWRHEAAWPPADTAPRTLYLSADGTLVEAAPKEGEVRIGGPMGATDLLVGDGGGRAAFGELAFPQGLHIAGEPVVNLTLSSDRPLGQVIVRLYEGDRRVSQGAYNLLYADGIASPEPLTPGAPVTVGFPLYPTDWVLEPGATLRVELSTVDAMFWYDTDAPAGALTLMAGESATLTLPTVERAPEAAFLVSCGKALEKVVDGCFKDLDDRGVEKS